VTTKRFQAVRNSLRTLFPGEPLGHLASRLNTLAALVSGIVGSKSTNLPGIATKVPDGARNPGTKPASRVKRFERWLRNKAVESETFFLPFAEALLLSLCHIPLVLAIDGSVVGRGCMTLMISVVYRQRALPIVWTVAKRRKGHFPEKIHIELMSKVQQLIPQGTRVVVLGDGEFDGVDLQALVNQCQWDYVLRTSKTSRLSWEGEEFRFDDVADHVNPGDLFDVPNALFTQRKYGPVLALTWWRNDCKGPIHLVTNMISAEEACSYYRKRFKIETFFSDQKSRGFHLHKSHLSDPRRLSRLLIATCLAYFWIIYLGAYAMESGWNKVIHRTDRCDLSLFQLGLRLLDHFLNQELPIPVAFTPVDDPLKYVR
jgi:Transposase DDE domain